MVGSFVAWTLVLCLLVILGYKSMQIHYTVEECEMTWMFHPPHYQRVYIDTEVEAANPRYSLHLYSESSYMFDNTADSSRALELTGIPALFIPGNAGSFRQCRSSASIALEMHPAEFSHMRHFDFFTVDLNEELSGIFGGVLLQQTRFVSACIRHILSMYKTSTHQPKSVAIIGHSMGGVVAQALLVLPGFNASWMNTIVALASPLKRPVIAFDHLLQQFYDSIEQEWTRKAVAERMTIVSIAGGHLDLMIPAHLTALNYSLNIAAAAVPRNWAHTGHQVVVWCRRLQLALTRALFLTQSFPRQSLPGGQTLPGGQSLPGGQTLPDSNIGLSHTNALLRTKVFRDYLFHGREAVINGTAVFAAGRKGCEVITERSAMRRKLSGHICWTKAHSWAQHNRSLLLATNSHTPLQVAACQSTSVLASCHPLSSLVTLLPPKHTMVKFMELEADQLPQNTSQLTVVLGNSHNDVDSFFLIEECNRTSYKLLPSFWGTSRLVLPSGDHCTVTSVDLPTITEIWQTYQLSVTSCAPIKVSLVTPWYPQSPSYDSGSFSHLVLPISLMVPTPIGYVPTVTLWANKSCDIHVTLSPDPLALIHKVVVLYSPQLLPWMLAASIAGPQTLPSACIFNLGVAILYSLTSVGTLLSHTDWYTLSQERLWGGWTPHVLFFVAMAAHHLILGAEHLACRVLQWAVPIRRQLACTSCLILLSFVALATTASAVGTLMMVLACMIKAKTTNHHQLVSVVFWLLPLEAPAFISWVRGLGFTLWQVDPHLPLALALNTSLAAWLLIGCLLSNHSATSKEHRWWYWTAVDTVLCKALLPASVVLVCSVRAYRMHYFVLTYALLHGTKELICLCLHNFQMT